MWTFFSQERQLASTSPLPADNITLAEPPHHKWMKICLLFFLLQLTRLPTLSTINRAWLFCTHLFRGLPGAALAEAPVLGVRSASPNRWPSRCNGKVLSRALSFYQQGLDWWRHSSFQVRGHSSKIMPFILSCKCLHIWKMCLVFSYSEIFVYLATANNLASEIIHPYRMQPNHRSLNRVNVFFPV